MKGFRVYRRFIAWPAAALMLLVSLPVNMAEAGMVSTERVIEQNASPAQLAQAQNRARVLQFLKRDDVREQMRSLGVDPKEAMSRAEVLSDAEISKIAGKLDELPAGGNAVGAIIGALVFVLVVLLITDLFCWTKVYPFTRCVGK
ncbi:MAG: PA2779 family protein [Alphaproteobacteria bacterium]|nr:PA2779 family protein [Alphaproteobacteria bacterium]